MEMRKGYKRTEVGMIPDDWDIRKVGDVLKVRHGKSQKNVQNINGQYPILGTGGLMGYSNSCLYDKPSVLIGRKGTIDKPQFMNTPFWTVDTLFYTEVTDDNSPKYLYYKFLQINWYNYNEASGVPSLNAKTIEKIKIALPWKNEQTIIATALSNADALISSLEKLIAKKRNIKQGVMQELLKPKGWWISKKMAELGRPYGGISGKSKSDFAGGNCPYIPFMNIMSNPIIDAGYLDFVTIKSGENQNQAQKGDLFFNGSSETPEEVGMCSVLRDDIPNLYLNSFCFGFRLNKELQTDGLYLAYFFRSNEGRKLLFSLAQGATRYNLSKSNFLKMQLLLPKPEEQISIANTLRDMDAEIAALETKLVKYKMIKQGMMQTLLTGQIRLI